jgi:hypothetical protein
VRQQILNYEMQLVHDPNALAFNASSILTIFEENNQDSEARLEAKIWLVGQGMRVPTYVPIINLNTIRAVELDLEKFEVPFSVYPNPALNYIRFGFDNSESDTGYRVINSLGQVIAIENLFGNMDHLVDVSNLTKGVYKLEIIKDATLVQSTNFIKL